MRSRSGRLPRTGSPSSRQGHTAHGVRSHLTLLALLLSLLVSACSSASTKVAGWYITRQIDHYVDLTSAQHDLVRPAVDREVDRVRREDLPRWIDLLRGVRDQIQHGPTDAATL